MALQRPPDRMSHQAPDASWEAFAAREPYFAVLTAPRFLRAQLTAETEREFFDSGQALVDYMFTLIQERLAPDFAPTAILEYGCGAGRLALPLARRADRRGGSVVAVDRSPAMLDAARKAASAHSVGNIDFQTADAFRQVPRTFDFISCILVLQRLPPSEGLALVRDLLSRLVPGGVAVFSVPYQTDGSLAVRITRWLRRRSRLVNAIVNRVRGKAIDEPFVPAHAYELSAVIGAIQEQCPATMNAVFEPQQGLRSGLLFAEAPLPTMAALRNGTLTSNRTGIGRDAPVNVHSLIAETSIDALNTSAEEYFASLTDRDHQTTKPFSQPHEMPALLAGMSAVLDGLNLSAGATVLEFGAGAGWLSRHLTQLGCHVILLDVSPTALSIARDLYRRLPVIGDRPAPDFLVFDGRHIDLPDACVDRILCFHAFHHVPNPAAIIREFGRVLRPGGIAGFAEPGPNHSKAPFSQFEMRTYKVVENDVDVHALWREAQDCGFARIEVAVFNSPPLRLSLDEFEEFLAGGQATAAWVAETRVFLRNTRTFFLTKGGAAVADSRRADGLACAVTATILASTVKAGAPIAVDAVVTNAGSATWLASNLPRGGVSLGSHLYRSDGALVAFDFCVEPLADPPRSIGPGETVRCRMTLPPQPPGQYVVELDCVASQVAWFAPLGSAVARLPFLVAADSRFPIPGSSEDGHV